MKPLPIVVLISGRGSNLQAIIDAADPLVDIKAVISNRPDAKGLASAQAANIVTEIIDHRQFSDRETFDEALQKRIDNYQPSLVVLAGFMRILSDKFVAHYRGRLLNIHPSLLPKFKGLHTHERALAEGVKEHGASVHFVTEALDAGPVILQAKVPVLPTDDVDTLAARVLKEEHRIYPQVIHWFAEGRLQLRGDKFFLDGQAK
jgi:phosphoribosylglycinamide formyltransferase-1